MTCGGKTIAISRRLFTAVSTKGNDLDDSTDRLRLLPHELEDDVKSLLNWLKSATNKNVVTPFRYNGDLAKLVRLGAAAELLGLASTIDHLLRPVRTAMFNKIPTFRSWALRRTLALRTISSHLSFR